MESIIYTSIYKLRDKYKMLISVPKVNCEQSKETAMF